MTTSILNFSLFPSRRRDLPVTHPTVSPTMPLSVIRKSTAEDRERLDASAWRFADRHGITLGLEDLGPAEELDMHLSWFKSQQRSYSLGPLWQACRCRALKVKVDASIAVGYGYVGYSVS
jgi:hypothetical protein